MDKLKLGDRVTIVGGYEVEWRGWEGFVCGMCMQIGGDINITVSDSYPPKHLGEMTDGFTESDLRLSDTTGKEG